MSKTHKMILTCADLRKVLALRTQKVNAALDQLEDRILGTDEAAGSIPAGSSSSNSKSRS